MAVVAVLAAYAFFASGGAMRFPSLSDSGEARYADLAAGFLRGHLYLAHDPDPKLAALPNPWEEKAREGIWYLWDASYYNGRYYLYFSPLPALFFHLPYYEVFRAWPSDALATAFFSAWAFLAAVWFVQKARGVTPLQILLIGLGNVIPWSLAEPHVYEVSVTAGMAMTATWAVAILAFTAAPTALRAANAGLWLALAIAARPNLGMLLFVTVAAILMGTRAPKRLFAFASPLVAVGAALAAYNMARFGQPLEFGVRYQLSHVSMFDQRVCGLSSLPELGRLLNHAMHYIFSAPWFNSRFPFVDLPHAHLDERVMWPSGGMTEAVAGLAPLVPVTIVGTLLALLLLLGLDRGRRDTGTRAALIVMSGGWLVLLGLSTCWWVVARYALDFTLLIVVSSLVCIDAALAQLARLEIRVRPLRLLVAALALFSVVTGMLLGFRGPGDAFARAHPETFRRISGWISR